jgi:hypothetical protein
MVVYAYIIILLLRRQRQEDHSQGKKALEKSTKSKKNKGVTQVVEHLPSKPEALSSNPSTIRNKTDFLLEIKNIKLSSDRWIRKNLPELMSNYDFFNQNFIISSIKILGNF